MSNFSLSYITGKLDYLEKNLQTLKQVIDDVAEKTVKKKSKLYGSLPKLGISFKGFQKIRQSLSSAWEQEWS